MYNYHRIRDLREDTDKTQEKLAKELKMHTTTYARYETGENRVPFDFAITLANHYDVSLDYIAGLTNEKKGLTKSQLSEDVSHLVKSYETLSDRRKGRLEQFLQQLVDEQDAENAKLKGVI